MIVVNQDRTLILETKDLWRDKNTIYCNNYTANEFDIRLATYSNEEDASYVFEDVLEHFTDKELYYLPNVKSINYNLKTDKSQSVFEWIKLKHKRGK